MYSSSEMLGRLVVMTVGLLIFDVLRPQTPPCRRRPGRALSSSESQSLRFPAPLQVARYGSARPVGRTIDHGSQICVDVLDDHVSRRSKSDVDLTQFIHAAAGYKQETSYEKVIAWAKTAKGNDEDGYRQEFINLVEMAEGLDKK